MTEDHGFFNKMVDELVLLGEKDLELKDGIQWLDKQAQKEGVTIYDKVYEVLLRYEANNNARKWVQGLNHG